MITTSSEGTAFKAMPTIIRQRTKEELQSEEASDKTTTSKTTDTQTPSQTSTQNQIIFTDPKTS